MHMSDPATRSTPLLDRLLGFLDQDPDNLALLRDAAIAAFEDRRFDLASALVERHRVIAAVPAALFNLEGLIAIGRKEFPRAVDIFKRLRSDGDDSPALRFNLAWAEAMQGAYQEALDLLDEAVLAISPRAPALKIQMMHHLALYEDALDQGRQLAERYPEDHMLMGALAALALDAERVDLARIYAQRAGDDAEGLAALGILTLGEQDIAASLALFDRAIHHSATNPRAWVGKGLALLAQDEAIAAAEAIDRGATLFGDHLGSWIASGWAYFVGGDYRTARARFEHARALDPNFAESHGGLAVLDIVEGRLEDARRSSDIALRLDRNALGGALAKSLLLQQDGDIESAARIREIALKAPIGPNGQTIAQALAAMSGGLRN